MRGSQGANIGPNIPGGKRIVLRPRAGAATIGFCLNPRSSFGKAGWAERNVAGHGKENRGGAEPAPAGREESMRRSILHRMLTDVQFWIPCAVLVLGIVILVLASRS